jgi:alpha-amylase
MTGEAWGHGVMQSDYYRHGFDAMINFDYQDQAAKASGCLSSIDLTWQQMADKLQTFNVLSYLSSHDTRLFREGGSTAAELLLLAPGAVQLFYGDESARPFGPTGSDPLQGTRSDMNWQDVAGKPRSASATGRNSASSAPATRRLAWVNKPRSRCRRVTVSSVKTPMTK